MKVKITLYLFFLVVISGNLNGQDIHFSQFNTQPLQLNPALAGVFPQDIRFSGIYRSQWQSVPVPYMTFSGSADMKIQVKKLKTGFAGAGIRFAYDKAGDSELSLAQISLTGAWIQPLNEFHFLSVGVEVSGYQRAFSMDNLQFGNQHNGDIFQATQNSGEDFGNNTTIYNDLGVGLNYYFQHEDKRHRFTIGGGVFHLNQPKVSFLNDQIELFRRISAFALFNIELNEKMDIILPISFQKQNVYTESVAGLQLKYYLKAGGWNQIAVQLGSAFRLGDAVIPSIGMDYGPWFFGMSYDITISQLNQINSSRGGPEFALIYTITKVKALKSHKACPIF